MNDENAIRKIVSAVEELAREGYVITGTLTFIKPVVPGLVRQIYTGHERPATALEIGVERVITAERALDGAVAEPRKELPTLEAGYTGNTCPSCYKARMVRMGTCEYCQDCGASNGCS